MYPATPHPPRYVDNLPGFSTEPDLFMINVNSSSQFYVGTYDPEAERMTVVGERQTLDSSRNYVYVWAAAGQMISRAPTSRPTPGLHRAVGPGGGDPRRGVARLPGPV